jgi:hypothetical protein
MSPLFQNQALSFIVALGTLSPALAALDATLYDETFVRICKRLCDAQKTLEAAARAQLNDFLSPRTFSGAAYGGATINITVRLPHTFADKQGVDTRRCPRGVRGKRMRRSGCAAALKKHAEN